MERLQEKSKVRPWVKKSHNWIGLGSGVFLVALLATGVALNHPSKWIAGADAQRLSLAADPRDPDRLYRGTASLLERSEDGGRTWEEVPMAFPPLEVVDIAFHPKDPGTVYILQRWHGPLKSDDGGVVWETVPLSFDPQQAGVELTGLGVSAAGDLYLETSQGLLTRPAGSEAWESLDFDLARKNWTRIVKTLHNGHFFGEWFVKVYDVSALALLLLIVTGIVLWKVK
jgi:hypothetical protein